MGPFTNPSHCGTATTFAKVENTKETQVVENHLGNHGSIQKGHTHLFQNSRALLTATSNNLLLSMFQYNTYPKILNSNSFRRNQIT